MRKKIIDIPFGSEIKYKSESNGTIHGIYKKEHWEAVVRYNDGKDVLIIADLGSHYLREQDADVVSFWGEYMVFVVNRDAPKKIHENLRSAENEAKRLIQFCGATEVKIVRLEETIKPNLDYFLQVF